MVEDDDVMTASEARGLLAEMAKAANGHTATAIVTATVNLLATLIVQGADSLQEAEVAVPLVRDKLAHAVRRHWEQRKPGSKASQKMN
jgi:hypothetical protein